ncbi:MAG: hypothetical protein FJ276_21930 [Planctomycetes bacterium]|nr:hypothetical protein [Planctomycetota bacterium]
MADRIWKTAQCQFAGSLLERALRALKDVDDAITESRLAGAQWKDECLRVRMQKHDESGAQRPDAPASAPDAPAEGREPKPESE